MMTLAEWKMMARALSGYISEFECSSDDMLEERIMLEDVRFTIERMSKSQSADGRMALLRRKEFGQ